MLRVVLLLMISAVAWAQSLPPPEQRPLQVFEGGKAENGYVSSKECGSCHTKQYSSWHRSYHRTMTQVVTADSVIADFDDISLGDFQLSRDETAFWVRPPESKTPKRVVQSTGSHHYQLYWYSTGNGRELRMLPFAFLKIERRWVPRSAVFLEPPGLEEEPLIWNVNCLPCHSTDGRPRYAADGAGPDTRVAELGIACEACHGPGEDHVAAASSDAPASPLVHPKKVTAGRSAEICGQCHSVNVPYTEEGWIDWLLDGPTFRPGESLAKHRYIVDPPTVTQSPLLSSWFETGRGSLDEWFWRDGMVRVTGREFTGLRKSPCYAGGQFSCVTCHSIHDGSRDDQLAANMRGSQACLQCHDWSTEQVTAHSGHAPDSTGNNCLNCHMPNTTYGLLKATRSHTVSSPSLTETLKAGRPNACNLCHLDRSLGWTQRHLVDRYGLGEFALPKERQEVAESVLGMLRGDAGERALYAWHMGWEPAQQASGTDWIPAYLAEGLTDTYAVVRYIAARSLRNLPVGKDLRYDYLAEHSELNAARQHVLSHWSADTVAGREALLIDPDGQLQGARFERLRQERTDPPVKLGE